MAVKQFLKDNWIFLILMLIVIFGFYKFISNQIYLNNYAWENLDVCNYQDMLTYEDYQNGKYCKLENCVLKDNDFLRGLNENGGFNGETGFQKVQKVDYTQTKVMGCVCPTNNKTINMICVERLSNKGLEKLKGWKKWS